MTERPILMSGAMVRACLREVDPKTQTRRALRPQPPEKLADTVHYDRATGGAMWASIHGDHGIACPYGRPGDRLWVRETFRGAAPWEWNYRADVDPATDGWRWTPAIHMPRAACRLLLDVTGVRIERLQDISEEDSKAEGIATPMYPPGNGSARYRYAYSHLWDSLNAKRGLGWDTNPWVWVVEFKRSKELRAAA